MNGERLLGQIAQNSAAAHVKLQDPMILRVAVLATLAAAGLGVVGTSMVHRVNALGEEIAVESERADLIKRYRYLNSRMKLYGKRLPRDGDLGWWTDSMLERTRACNLKVVQLSPTFVPKGKRGNIGELMGVFLRLEVEGDYKNLVRFIGEVQKAKYLTHFSQIRFVRESLNRPIKMVVTIDTLTQKPKETKGIKGNKDKKRAEDAKPSGEGGKASGAAPQAKEEDDAS